MSHFNIIIDNIWTYIKSDSVIQKSLLKILQEEMSYTVPIYNQYAKKTIEVNEPLFEKEFLRYPTGLYSFLDKILTREGHTFSVTDARDCPSINNPMKFHSKQLRDYQEEAVENSINSERGVIKIATGGGKTVIGAAIVARLNLKTIFIVNSIDLLGQTADEFEKMFKLQVGRVGGGFCDIRQINVCTIQTLFSAFNLKFEGNEEGYIKEKTSKKVLQRKQEIREMVEGAEVIINDECHHQTSHTYVETMKLCKSSYFKFSLSATPFKDSSIDNVLTAYSGKLICNINASYLIDRGFLVQPKVHILDPNEYLKYKYVEKSYKYVYDNFVVRNEKRNNLITECTGRLLDLSKTVLITVTQISHGDIICEKLDKAGIKSLAFIQGECDKELRKQLLNKIRNKELNVLVGSSVADEGLDLPALDSAILAGGGKSYIKSLQRVGRTLRPYTSENGEKKTEAIVVDFYDRVRYLVGHSKKRIEIYESEPRFEVIKNFTI